jgi:thiol-disulfide isomerase/thioredoxin
LIVACTLFIAPLAAAQELTTQAALEQRFKQLDKNGDGKITTDEVPQSPFFAQRDKNGDGVITLAEAKAELESGTVSAPTSSAPNAKQATPQAKESPRITPSSKARKSPQQFKAADHGVGRFVADVPFTDIAGVSQKLSSLTKKQTLVVAMTSTSCPLSKKYLPTLAQLAKSYSERGIKWLLVNPIATDTSDDMRAAKKSIDGAVYVHDRDGILVRAIGALTTTDVIVLDASRTVLFHGAIDDQYGLGYSIDAPRHRYLADALDAILLNKQPPIAATDAPGCLLATADQPPAHASITYHNRISRIVQRHCMECHRNDGVAPFSLATHQEVMSHVGMIKQVVGLETMPPWFAKPLDAGSGQDSHSLWANDRSLTEADKHDLLKWIEGGGPKGDERDAPQPVSFHKGWQIGKPDAVFKFAEAVPIKATGTMPYQNIIVETNLAEDKWVQAIEIQPGDRGVVHHMMVYLLAAQRDQLSLSDEAADERNGYWAIYVPGNGSLVYPDGFAKPLPKNAKLRCQVHYTPNGTATTDLSRIGVVFAKLPPQHEVRVVGVGNPRIAIPPGAENHREDGSLRLPFDIHVLGFLPHMHVRGKACRYKAVSTSGDVRTLLDIPHYDFNWQLQYRYAEPEPVLRGESIKFTAWYDNSAKNPANPDPTQTVRWGKQANDEMHLGYVEYYIPAEVPGKPNDKNRAKAR